MCKTNNPINRGFIPIQIYALLFVYLAFVNTKCKQEAYYIECEMTTMLLLYIPSSFFLAYIEYTIVFQFCMQTSSLTNKPTMLPYMQYYYFHLEMINT